MIEYDMWDVIKMILGLYIVTILLTPVPRKSAVN